MLSTRCDFTWPSRYSMLQVSKCRGFGPENIAGLPLLLLLVTSAEKFWPPPMVDVNAAAWSIIQGEVFTVVGHVVAAAPGTGVAPVSTMATVLTGFGTAASASAFPFDEPATSKFSL